MHISWYLNILKHFIIQCGATVIVDIFHLINMRRRSVKEMSRAGPKKGAQNQPCQPRSFQGMSEKEEKFKQNQVQ